MKSLESAHRLLRTLSTHPELINSVGSIASGEWSDVLEQEGLEGLTRTCSFHQNQGLDKDCLSLMEKLIEVSLFCPQLLNFTS